MRIQVLMWGRFWCVCLKRKLQPMRILGFWTWILESEVKYNDIYWGSAKQSWGWHVSSSKLQWTSNTPSKLTGCYCKKKNIEKQIQIIFSKIYTFWGFNTLNFHMVCIFWSPIFQNDYTFFGGSSSQPSNLSTGCGSRCIFWSCRKFPPSSSDSVSLEELYAVLYAHPLCSSPDSPSYFGFTRW